MTTWCNITCEVIALLNQKRYLNTKCLCWNLHTMNLAWAQNIESHSYHTSYCSFCEPDLQCGSFQVGWSCRSLLPSSMETTWGNPLEMNITLSIAKCVDLTWFSDGQSSNICRWLALWVDPLVPLTAGTPSGSGHRSQWLVRAGCRRSSERMFKNRGISHCMLSSNKSYGNESSADLFLWCLLILTSVPPLLCFIVAPQSLVCWSE